jgi:hypothetical protein
MIGQTLGHYHVKASFDLQLDARILAAQLQVKVGNAAAGVSALALIEKDAVAQGFLLAARKAKESGSKHI